MQLEQLTPKIGGSKSVREVIIHVLSEEWPLTSNEIYNKAKRKYGIEASYQAFHKMLKQMVAQNVLARKEKKYSIDMQWAEGIEKFSKNLKTKLVSHTPLYLDGLSDFREETGMQVFVFDSFGAAEEYRKKLQKEYIEMPGPKQPYIGQSRHLKSPIVYSEKSLAILNAIKELKTNCYFLVAGKTKVDEWCAKYYQNEFVRIKTGSDVAKNCEIMILGDVITQMYAPKQIQDYIDKVYDKAKRISDIDIPKFNEKVYGEAAKTKFVVYRTKELSEQIRKQTIEQFKRINLDSEKKVSN